jgi:preprotein translocase subunit SecA
MQRRAAYECDITYGTNNEFGFDYLRDNMRYRLEDMVQRDFNFAIVDEVDSILIDEARTPLIISGPSDESSDLYRQVDEVMKLLVTDPDTYEKDEKQRTVALTELGGERVEDVLRSAGVLIEGNLYDIFNVSLVHHAQQSLRAHTLYARDVDYIVRNGEVILIDEFTGRMMQGRRFSEGLHQALEAKEHVTVQPENQTLASITFQNYFRLYPKLAGMTGTAMTEADEFAEIYKLEVIEIPTNVSVIRNDEHDEVYRTAEEKYEAVAKLIDEARQREQPVLVGTTSIEKSEIISELLKKKRVPHAVLNARYHEQESEIVAQAGAPGTVTIATNMAGRGTDIKLGGNLEMRLRKDLDGVTDEAKRQAIEETVRTEIAAAHEVVKQAGGLLVIGTERHESRRVDNQLRGRSGRQGDPGQSRFFLSLEDDLMRIFGSDRMGGMLQRLGLQQGEAIVHPWINKALEKAQKKVEARNFDMRKNVLKYDDVMNAQRKEVYAQRKEFMRTEDVSETIADMRSEILTNLVRLRIPGKGLAENWALTELAADLKRVLDTDLPVEQWGREEGIDETALEERVEHAAARLVAEKEQRFGRETMHFIEKSVLIQLLDTVWKEHLYALDHLRQGIGLRAYGQRDPLNEYKSEAFVLFNFMLDELKQRVTTMLSRVEIAESPPPVQRPFETALREIHAAVPGPGFDQGGDARELEPAWSEQAVMVGGSRLASEAVDPLNPSTWGSVGRNAACPCGSGKKYKYCHGRLN